MENNRYASLLPNSTPCSGIMHYIVQPRRLWSVSVVESLALYVVC